MKSFRELKLIGSASEQRRLITLIEQRLSNGWTRERLREIQLNSRTGRICILFARSETASRPAADLSFMPDKNGYLGVSHIVARDMGELSKDQYNAILEEFLTQFVEPAAQGLDIEIRTTSSERTIDNSMSLKMAQLLKRFSVDNKPSSGTHPSDEARFLDFIVQAHREEALLDEAQLSELLIEDGWSSEYAQELSSKYRFGRDLLSHYSE